MIKKIIIGWTLVALWIGLIFFMSSMDTNESNNKSMKTIDKTIESTLEVTNGLGITDKHPSGKRMNQVIEKLNKPLRKVAHASEYCILAILIYLCLRCVNIKKYKLIILPILLSFLYACTDEYHQSFVQGRTSQFTDVLIDTAGAVIGVILISFIFYLKDKRHNLKAKEEKITNTN